MKIICFTDCLGSGGAQRQLSLLAVLLKRKGHEVLFVTYNAGEHFTPDLVAAGVARVRFDNWPKLFRPIALHRLLRKFNTDGVIVFQEAPSFYAEIASFFNKRWRLVVSERNAIPPNYVKYPTRLLLQSHRLADVVTTNSVANRIQIESEVPALRGRLHTIYNAVDLERFRPMKRSPNSSGFNLVVLSSHKEQKNFEKLAQAVKFLLDDNTLPTFFIEWFGGEAAPGWLYRDKTCCDKIGISSVVRFHPPTQAPEVVLNQADALILPSLWEGLPNAVCEALSVGCPVLMSDVADARFLVQEGVTGYLFDPRSPKEIAEAVKKFLLLSGEAQQEMRVEARKFAERAFDPERYVSEYEMLLDYSQCDKGSSKSVRSVR